MNVSSGSFRKKMGLMGCQGQQLAVGIKHSALEELSWYIDSKDRDILRITKASPMAFVISYLFGRRTDPYLTLC